MHLGLLAPQSPVARPGVAAAVAEAEPRAAWRVGRARVPLELGTGAWLSLLTGQTSDAQQTPHFRRTVHAARERQGVRVRAHRYARSWTEEAQPPGGSKKGEQVDVQRRRADHTLGTVLQADHRCRAK